MTRVLVLAVAAILAAGATAAAQDADAAVGRGVKLIAEKKFDEALKEFEAAAQARPDYAQAWAMAGEMASVVKDYDKAIRYLTRALALSPKDPAYLFYERAVAYTAKKDYDAGIADVGKVLAINPKMVEALILRGDIYTRAGQPDKAVADYDKAVLLDKNSWVARAQRGIACEARGDYDQAIKDYTKAKELNADYVFIYIRRGRAYGYKGDYDAALKDLDEAVRRMPDDATGFVERGMLNFDRGEFAKAVPDLETAARLAPADPEPRLRLYVALKRLGKDGTDDLKAFRKDLKDAEWPAAVVRMYLEELSPAECLQAAADKDKQHARDQKSEALFHIAEFHLIHGDAEHAKRTLHDCVQLNFRAGHEFWSAKAELERLEAK